MSAQRATEPEPGRVWSEPGLLRRVQAHDAAKPPRRPPGLPWWRRLTPPSTRWTAEGTFMLFLAAACITIGAAVTAAVGLDHPGPTAPTSVQSRPVPTAVCMAVPIPYSGRPRCS
jgi:hypothetical protein